MKKVLSLVLAAAMTMGIAATSFAAMSSDKQDTNASTMKVTVDGSVKDPVNDGSKEGTTLIGDLTPGAADIKATESADFEFHVVAVANEKDSRTNKSIDYNHWNFATNITVKGPAEVTKDKIDTNSFRWYTKDGKTYLSFDVTFTLKGTNEGATDFKGLVVKYGVKTVDVPTRSGLKGNTATNTNIAAGYSDEDVERLYDDVVNGFDDMESYGENSYEVSMYKNPVIPSSVIRFLQKNLSSSKSVIFVKDNDGDSVYFDSTSTLELTGKAIKEFSSTAHANIKVNGTAVDEIKDALDEADVDNTWFNYVVHRDIEATHSFDSGYNDPHIYLINEDGSLTEVELKDYDYGDVAFTGPMTQYVITEGAIPEELFDDETTDEPIEDDDLIDEPTEDDDNLVDEDGNPIENNPGTGSSNAISLAVAMAVVSLAAAGLVASKKASK